MIAAAFLFEDKMDQTSPYIHSPDDVSLPVGCMG